MKILIFGGTTEGRELSAELSKYGIDVTLSVATEFGRNTAGNGTSVLVDRLGEEEIIDLLKQEVFDCVIDATHPYAILATQNISFASRNAGIKYLRLKRPEGTEFLGATYVSDAAAAVEILKKSDDKALLTIGSKELEPFTQMKEYHSRLFIRILPMPESLEKAIAFGFQGSNIICMQGPFDKEMNTATLKMIDAKYLVTKDSGDIGGLEAKVSAALELGCEVIIIKRPVEKEGYTFDEILSLIR